MLVMSSPWCEGCVRDPILTIDMAKIPCISGGKPSHELALRVELGPNLNFNMVLESILLIVVGLIGTPVIEPPAYVQSCKLHAWGVQFSAWGGCVRDPTLTSDWYMLVH